MPMIFRNLQYLTRNELKYRIGLNLEYVEFRKNNEKDVFSSSTNNNIIINNVNLTNSMYINIGESTIRLTPYIGLKYKLDNNNDLRFQLNYSFNLYNNQYTTCYSHDFHYTKHSHIGTYTDVKNSSFLFNQNGISINNIFSLQPFFFKVEYAFGG